MKQIKLFIFAIAACVSLIGAWRFGYIVGQDPAGSYLENSLPDSGGMLFDAEDTRLYRGSNLIDFSGLKFTPWDVNAASANIDTREKKPYTIMIYMNGSDLESIMGAATGDIIEMQKSGVDAKNVNIILFTGGTNRWNNNVIPSNKCVIWEIADGRLYKIAGVGLRNMGDPGTLASFIDFSARNFPADKFGLIMWDHGGGSIAGYGHDEKFNHSYLTLLDMNYAFEKSAISENKLEFLGFDSCLMATVEMAVVASGYADYLIASEDIEPTDGWDYGFLSALNDDPGMNGAALGRVIVNSFMDFYGEASDENLALSVTELSGAGDLMGALGNLMRRCSDSLLIDSEASFKVLAAKRGGTKTFGVGSPRDNECDMVDIGDMAEKLSGLFPDETADILKELDNCVVYNRHNSDTELGGLSAYYIYGGKNIGSMSLDTYSSLNVNGDYTQYLHDFFGMLRGNGAVNRGRSQGSWEKGEEIPPHDEAIDTKLTIWRPLDGGRDGFIMTGIQDGVDLSSDNAANAVDSSLWPTIYGQNVCLYKIGGTEKSSLYAVPAALNGRDCDIIISVSEQYPNGKILGSRQEDGLIVQKGCDKIPKGGKIEFYYRKRDASGKDIGWHKGDELTVGEESEIDWSELEGENFYSLLVTDIRNDEYFTELRATRL